MFHEMAKGYHASIKTIKTCSCVFQSNIPHQWIAQQQVDPVSVYCDGSGTSCPVSAPWHSCVAAHWSKYHCYKQAPSWYDLRCLKAKLNPNKQTPSQTNWRSCSYITFFLNVLRLPPPHEKVHHNWNINSNSIQYSHCWKSWQSKMKQWRLKFGLISSRIQDFYKICVSFVS